MLLSPKEGLWSGFTRSREGTLIGSEEGGTEGTISKQREPILVDTGVEGNIKVDDDDRDVDNHIRWGATRWGQTMMLIPVLASTASMAWSAV